MVGMCGRVVQFDNVPVSERLYFYNIFHMKKYKHLYYCKNCVLNFESAKQASVCSRCRQTEIVELHPKDFMKAELHFRKLEFPKIKYKIPKMKFRKPEINFFKRAKIWFYYATTKPQEELPTK